MNFCSFLRVLRARSIFLSLSGDGVFLLHSRRKSFFNCSLCALAASALSSFVVRKLTEPASDYLRSDSLSNPFILNSTTVKQNSPLDLILLWWVPVVSVSG